MVGFIIGRREINLVFKQTHDEKKEVDCMGAKNQINNEGPKISSECPPFNVQKMDKTGIYNHGFLQHTIYLGMEMPNPNINV